MAREIPDDERDSKREIAIEDGRPVERRDADPGESAPDREDGEDDPDADADDAE